MNSLCQSLTATFDTLPNARILGNTKLYGLLQSAYDDASDTGAVIQAKGVTLVENLSMDKSKNLNIEGGFDPIFSVQNGNTILQGTLTIALGRVVLNRLTIE